ncbi:unnamed protein product, partial [Vitis vinifera]
MGDKPHVVCIPFPAQGHIKPMLKLAKLLHYRGFHITFVNTEFNHKRLLRSRGPHALDGMPGFCFESIPDGLPPLNDAPSSNVPPVTCIVSDGSMCFTLKASEELGIPNVLFWTTSACGFMAYKQFRPLIDGVLVPLKDLSYLTNGYLETIIDWVPGMKNMRLRDFPSFIRTRDPSDHFMLDFIIDTTDSASKASGLILNTFHALEHDVLNPLSSMFPTICTVGPLPLLLNQIPDDNSIESNLWREETECLQWLNSKQPNSVVYSWVILSFCHQSLSMKPYKEYEEGSNGMEDEGRRSHSPMWFLIPEFGQIGGHTAYKTIS